MARFGTRDGQVRRLGACANLPIVNDFRTVRVSEVLSDFQSIQYFIAAAPVDPPNMNDYYTEGWAALRQCNLDGQRILNCGADTSVPETSGGPDEQAKAELKQSVTAGDAPFLETCWLTAETFCAKQSSTRCVCTPTRGTENIPPPSCCAAVDRVSRSCHEVPLWEPIPTETVRPTAQSSTSPSQFRPMCCC